MHFEKRAFGCKDAYIHSVEKFAIINLEYLSFKYQNEILQYIDRYTDTKKDMNTYIHMERHTCMHIYIERRKYEMTQRKQGRHTYTETHPET